MCWEDLKNVDWPAWIQALGMIVGIGIAIYVPARQRQQQVDDEAAQRNVRSRSCAITLHPLLVHADAHLNLVEEFIDNSVKHGRPVSRDYVDSQLVIGTFEEMAEHMQKIESLPEDLAADVLNLIAWGRRYNEMINKNAHSMSPPNSDKVQIQPTMKLAKHLVPKLKELSTASLTGISPIVPIVDDSISN